MEEDIANDLTYFLQLDLQHKAFLGQLRHWDNLKMATDEGIIWVKDLTAAQLGKVELKSVPFAHLFYAKDNLLFPIGSLLPSRKLPALLWTPVERALPIILQDFNHNLFDIDAQVPLRLLPSAEEQLASVLITGVAAAGSYIETAPAARLQRLKWTVINTEAILLMGNPLLPLNGKAYWQKGHFIFPVGFIPEFTILEDIAAAAIDAPGTNYIWWTDEENYCLLHKEALQPLSIASWRQTMPMVQQKTANESQ